MQKLKKVFSKKRINKGAKLIFKALKIIIKLSVVVLVKSTKNISKLFFR